MRQIFDALTRYAQIRVYAVLILVITIFVSWCLGLAIGGKFGYELGYEKYQKIEDALRTGKAGRYSNIMLSCEWRKWKPENPQCNVRLIE